MAIDYKSTGYNTAGDVAARQAFFKKFGYNNADWQSYENRFAGATQDFAAQFKSLVGRDPDANEVSSYLGQIVGGSGLDAFGNNRGLELSQLASNYIGNTYAGDVEQRGLNELQGQQAEAQRLSDLFRTQGNQAINDTESSLLDYQNKLFERLRPNLITSLQSQGLLNTGGLNQAMAGAQGDLATAGSEELRNLRLQNEQQANAIQFGGQSAPYEYQKALAQSRVPNAQNAANTGLNNAYGTFMNQLNFQNQMALMNQQAAINASNSNKGGFFKQLGGALPGMLNQTFGNAFGSAASGQTSQNLASANYYNKAALAL
jgi:hypothetical protein